MKIAAIQMVSCTDVAMNMKHAYTLLEQAQQQGAHLAVLPEYWPIMGRRDSDKVECAEEFGAGPLQDFLSDSARQLGIHLIGGSIPLSSPDSSKIFNACLAYDAQGKCLTRYDKMHLFGFQQGEESYQESNTIVAGDEVVTVEIEGFKFGLGICYDLRFPELFRQMGHCDCIVLPAAFTHTTGQAHWDILLRARAIENQCYVLASAQGGLHENGRRTWGHSMVIDPWGTVLACLDEGEGIAMAELNRDQMETIRRNLPALRHRRLA